MVWNRFVNFYQEEYFDAGEEVREREGFSYLQFEKARVSAKDLGSCR